VREGRCIASSGLRQIAGLRTCGGARDGALDGKRALVTAAGQGIGRASALMMAREGARVLATDVNEAALAELAAEGAGGLETRRLDVLDPASIAEGMTAAGPLDVLFNCAGFVAAGTLLDCDEEQWAFSVSLNMTAMFRMCRAALPGMIGRGGGSVINMASVAGSILGVPNRFVYGATKAGVIGLTKSIAADFVGQNIRCNAIAPGTVESPSLEGRLRATGDYEAARKAFVARQPMGRIGRPRRSPRWSCTSRPTSRATPPDRSTSSTAACPTSEEFS
jgi:2-keto-3-deoxy-L-fuconate dehydrogenase